MSNSEEIRETANIGGKFAADRMLGNLVKWLRVLGQDVIYGPHLTGYGLIRAARVENRLILTRDRRLKQKQPPDFLLIESDHLRDQMQQLVRTGRLDFSAPTFTRCLRCNSSLQAAPKETIEKLVPAYVFATQVSFSRCLRCRRVYWPGTHHQQMVDQLARLELR